MNNFFKLTQSMYTYTGNGLHENEWNGMEEVGVDEVAGGQSGQVCTKCLFSLYQLQVHFLLYLSVLS